MITAAIDRIPLWVTVLGGAWAVITASAQAAWAYFQYMEKKSRDEAVVEVQLQVERLPLPAGSPCWLKIRAEVTNKGSRKTYMNYGRTFCTATRLRFEDGKVAKDPPVSSVL